MKRTLLQPGCIDFAQLAILTTMTAAQTMSDLPRTTVDPVRDNIIHLSAHLAVSPTTAFAHFTENDLLESWLTAEANVEATTDGSYELFWQPADRENNSTIGCRITALTPGQLLAFQWRSPQQFKAFANAADPLTHVTVTFIPEGNGTRVHLVHSGWRGDHYWEEARRWQERAWAQAIAALERLTGTR